MINVKRRQLLNVRSRSGVVVHGFGELANIIKFGTLVCKRKHVIELRFVDEDGSYFEKYSTHSGKRIEDIDRPDGWFIILSDLSESDNVVISNLKQSNRVIKVHEEVVELASDESLLWQVWRHKSDEGLTSLYLKSFRRRVDVKENKEGELVRRTKEFPAMIPFEKLVELLGEFVISEELK